MTKPRDILKGKVKRLLRAQEDMGQLCEPAVQHCVSALEAFVHDLGRRLKSQAETTGVDVVTPVELKRCVLASEDLSFLHEKVHAIDESDAKYHKPTRKRKAPATKAATSSKAKKPRSTKQHEPSAAVKSVSSKRELAGSKPVAATAVPATTIEEDDNYDSSDSE